MKKSFFLFAVTACLVLPCFWGCSNKDPKEGIITIYGTIIDNAGNPIPSVSVSISPSMDRKGNTRLICSGSKSVTGSDGIYEIPLYCAFEDVGYERYQSTYPIELKLVASKTGYKQSVDIFAISPSMLNQRTQVSLILEKW